MLIGIFFYTTYMIIAACTAWVAQAVFGAHIAAHPKTRDLAMEWISWPLGVLCGITWPVVIPVAVIIAGVMK